MSNHGHYAAACRKDYQCVYADGHDGPHAHDPRREDRTYQAATRDIDWRLIGDAPIVDLPPCVCGEERVDPLPDGYRCITCGVVRRIEFPQ